MIFNNIINWLFGYSKNTNEENTNEENKEDKTILILEKDYLLSKNGNKYPIINNIPRFVDSNNYSNSFGFQWNKFSRTQLDSQTKQPITHNRFWRATGWKASEISKAKGGY